MWFAVTAQTLSRSKKESKKEFHSRSLDIILSAETKEELEKKLRESLEKYPEQMSKYLNAGIKFVEADNTAKAKSKAKKVPIYFDRTGQYHFI